MAALLRVPRNLKHAAVLTTLYAAGLRLSEVAKLMTSTASGMQSMCVRLRDTGIVRSCSRPNSWLRCAPIGKRTSRGNGSFLVAIQRAPSRRVAIFRICREAVQAAGISQSVSPHSLRLLRRIFTGNRHRSAHDSTSARSSQPEDHSGAPRLTPLWLTLPAISLRLYTTGAIQAVFSG